MPEREGEKGGGEERAPIGSGACAGGGKEKGKEGGGPKLGWTRPFGQRSMQHYRRHKKGGRNEGGPFRMPEGKKREKLFP